MKSWFNKIARHSHAILVIGAVFVGLGIAADGWENQAYKNYIHRPYRGLGTDAAILGVWLVACGMILSVVRIAPRAKSILLRLRDPRLLLVAGPALTVAGVMLYNMKEFIGPGRQYFPSVPSGILVTALGVGLTSAGVVFGRGSKWKQD